MASKNTDLWPDDIAATPDVETPVTILKEQASLLGQKTKNIVEATVVSSNRNDDIIHTFDLIAPALGHYRYSLFSVYHPTFQLYPLTVVFRGKKVSVESQDDFINYLKDIFSNNKTKEIVQSLILQSGS